MPKGKKTKTQPSINVSKRTGAESVAELFITLILDISGVVIYTWCVWEISPVQYEREEYIFKNAHLFIF